MLAAEHLDDFQALDRSLAILPQDIDRPAPTPIDPDGIGQYAEPEFPSVLGGKLLERSEALLLQSIDSGLDLRPRRTDREHQSQDRAEKLHSRSPWPRWEIRLRESMPNLSVVDKLGCICARYAVQR